MEVICINGKFPPETVAFYTQYGVQSPKQDKIYNIRQVINHATKPGDGNKIGVLLEELKNPKVPVQNPILGETMMEPTFDIKRFSNLDGTEINEKELIKETIKNKI
ncbi:MAG: hypothetical protein WCP46_00330 [Alphaproteobacteria bacterium]